MRTGYKNGLLFGTNDEVVAVNLGADYCAEHEWGIKGLKRDFGLSDDESKFGIVRRAATQVPKSFEWYHGVTGKGKTATKFAGFWSPPTWSQKPEPYNVNFYGDGKLYTAWDEKEFAVFSNDPDTLVHLKEIFDAFHENPINVAIWLGGGGVFQNAGLAIAIKSRLEPEVLQAWHKTDKERYEIKEEVLKTGIEDRLKQAKRGYYALSPRREADGSLVFWLNPTEQNSNKAGWFTIKDLDDWIAGKGKIPGKQK